MKYTIHVSFTGNELFNLYDRNVLEDWYCAACDYYQSYIIESKKEGEDDIQIKFHKDPEVSGDGQNFSLISVMYFNRL